MKKIREIRLLTKKLRQTDFIESRNSKEKHQRSKLSVIANSERKQIFSDKITSDFIQSMTPPNFDRQKNICNSYKYCLSNEINLDNF